MMHFAHQLSSCIASQRGCKPRGLVPCFDRGAVISRAEAAVIRAVPDEHAARGELVPQCGIGRPEQQEIRLARINGHPAPAERRRQMARAPPRMRCAVCAAYARSPAAAAAPRLRDDRHVPRLSGAVQPLDEAGVRRHAPAEAHARHGVHLGVRPQEHQFGVRREQRLSVRCAPSVKKSLKHSSTMSHAPVCAHFPRSCAKAAGRSCARSGCWGCTDRPRRFPA